MLHQLADPPGGSLGERVEALSMSPELFSTLSHELRTPLAAIKGFAQGLIAHWDRLPPAKQLQFVEHILQASLRLERLVLDLSLAGRLAEGVPPELEPFDPLPVVAQAVEEIQALHPERTFTVLAGKGSVVRADRQRLQQVLVNLLDNAAKYSPVAEPVGIDWLHAGEMLRVEVRDRGVSLTLEEQTLLFTRFGRLAQAAGGRAPAGSGLGLAICKGLVEAMSGAIGIEADASGSGNIFWFTVPCLSPHPPAH